jgi:hypothetical protein
MPSLERLLTYGDGLHATPQCRSLESWQSELLSALNLSDALRYPSAPLTWLGATGSPPPFCLHAQPVALSTSSQGLSLRLAQPWSEGTLAAVEKCISGHLAELNLRWRVAGGQAFIHSDRILNVHTTSAQQAVREILRDAMPSGADAVVVRRWMNDLQMLMHDRFEHADFNALWLWGVGSITTPTPSLLPQIWTDDAYARGVYGMHDVLANCHVPPTGLGEMLNSNNLGVAVVRDDLERIERLWFAPALNALNKGQVGRIALYLDGYQACAQRSWLRRWFAQSRPLTELPA